MDSPLSASAAESTAGLTAAAYRQELLNLVGRTKSAFNAPFVVTANVKKFVETLAGSIYKAITGKRLSNRGNNYVLLGKGVGNTSLLNALNTALPDCNLNGWKVVVLRLDMNVVAAECQSDVAHPIEQLAKSVKFELKNAVTNNNFDALYDAPQGACCFAARRISRQLCLVTRALAQMATTLLPHTGLQPGDSCSYRKQCVPAQPCVWPCSLALCRFSGLQRHDNESQL
jgi:hypothetical protein